MRHEPIKFPGWRYGPKGEAEIFERAADVPEGWTDNPNDFVSVEPKADDPDTASRDELKAALDARGIPYDGRWGDDKLRKLLE
jgi:hypothetical protein